MFTTKFKVTFTIFNHFHHFRELQVLSLLEDTYYGCTQTWELSPGTLETFSIMILPTIIPIGIEIAS